jgi:hypothetical protein
MNHANDAITDTGTEPHLDAEYQDEFAVANNIKLVKVRWHFI